MDQHGEATTSVALTPKQIDAKIEQLEEQVYFVNQLWTKNNDNAEGIHRVVMGNAGKLMEIARAMPKSPLRRQALKELGVAIGILNTIKKEGFRFEGSGALHPAKFTGRVRSVKPAGPPGSGKRR